MKTTYDRSKAEEYPHVEVYDKKTGKVFFMLYKNYYELSKAINKIRRGTKLQVLSTNERSD